MKTIVKFFLVMVCFIPASIYAQNCVNFESQVLGTQYGNGFNAPGDVIFIEDDIPVSVENFQWTSGGTFGNCHIIDGTAMSLNLNAMWTNNINLMFDFSNLGFQPNMVSFDFVDSGGHENISINGHPIFVGEIINYVPPPGFMIEVITTSTPHRVIIVGNAPITELLVGGQEFALDNICANHLEDPSDCIDFYLLTHGTEFGSGINTIGEVVYIENDIPMSVEYFEWTTGGTFGTATVIDGTPTFGTGQAMWTNNINLRFDLSLINPASTWISFDYIDQGGHENLGINGHPLFVGELSAAVLPPGFNISITNSGKYNTATITNVNGIITELVVGGQEFAIDNICPSYDVSIAEAELVKTTTVVLGQNYPNPHNGHTVIPFRVTEKAHLMIKIYDYLGREVATLADDVYEAGEFTVGWDAGQAQTGIYFYQLSTAWGVQTLKMNLIK